MQFFSLEREWKLLPPIVALMTRVGGYSSVQPFRDEVLRTRIAVCEGEHSETKAPLLLEGDVGKIHIGIARSQHLLVKINDRTRYQS